MKIRQMFEALARVLAHGKGRWKTEGEGWRDGVQ
jgi:hypothetical protein